MTACATELGAVVLSVSMTGTDVVDPVSVTVDGLKEQAVCDGRFEHEAAERVPDPLSPFCAVKLSVVDPDCPGLAILIVDGFAEIENVPPTSISVDGEVDALKLESPLY